MYDEKFKKGFSCFLNIEINDTDTTQKHIFISYSTGIMRRYLKLLHQLKIRLKE